MTRGRFINFFRKLYSSERGRILLSMLFTSLLFAFVYITLPIVYCTNDDTSIMYTLAGYKTGSPYPIHQFINCGLGYIVSFFYSVFHHSHGIRFTI